MSFTVQTPKLHVNQIVEGARVGTYVILALRTIDGVEGAQVKAVHPTTHEPAPGEFWLPTYALRIL